MDDMMGKDEGHESVSAYIAALGTWEVKSYPAVGKVFEFLELAAGFSL